MQGSSVLHFLAGRTSTPPANVRQVGYELFGMKAFFSGHWKILQMPKPYGTGDWELFNLQQDPAELVDLSKKNPKQRAKLIALWEQYRQDNGVLDIALDVSAKMK